MRPLFINYGCGFQAPETWLNYDASPTLIFEKIPFLGNIYVKNTQRFPRNIRRGDIVKGLPVAENSAAAIYCSHVLEHLALSDFHLAIKNTYKYLMKGGVFRLVVPDLEYAINEYCKSTDNYAAHRFLDETILGYRNRTKGFYGLLKYFFGNSNHLWMWDEKSLRAELTAAGFAYIRRAEFGDSKEKKFKEVENPLRFEKAICMESIK